MPKTNVATRVYATKVAAELEVAIAFIPTTICRSGPTCPPSVTSTGVLRALIRRINIDEAKHVTALTRTAT